MNLFVRWLVFIALITVALAFWDLLEPERIGWARFIAGAFFASIANAIWFKKP